MQTSNPVFTRSTAFQAQPADQPYAGQPYSGQTYPGQTYGQTYGQSYGQPPYEQAPGQTYPGQAPQPFVQAPGVMTIDDVLNKTAITMGLLILSAAASYYLFDSLFIKTGNIGPLGVITTVSALIAFGTVLLVSFRRGVKPGFVLAYSVVEGVFIGAISLIFEFMYPGIVLPAAFGTLVTAGLTLAVYKGLRIKVSSKFRKMVVIGTGALAIVYLLNFVLSLFGVHLGVVSVTGSVSGLAILFSAIGVGLAVFNLILDFDYIEQGIAARAPANESWRGAFGLAVTMVWLYVELLRILSYFRR